MVEITVKKNGSYVVQGGVVLKDADGNVFEPKNPERYSLCRCGHSQTKPFCDGSHKTSDFRPDGE